MQLYGKEYQNFLDNLKVGDKVCFDTARYGHPIYTITTIKRITPKRSFVTNGDVKFNKEGYNREDKYHSLILEPYTDEIANNIKRRNLEVKAQKLIANIRIENLDNNQLEKLIDLLTSFNKNVGD